MRSSEMKRKIIHSILFLMTAGIAAASGQTRGGEEIVAAGGSFTLEKSVTAGGGAAKQGASVGESGTAGQAAAGVRSTGGNFSLDSGFWTPESFVPTAAEVAVGGRVLTAGGAGIRGVRVTIAFPNGERRTTVSSTFGRYRFDGIPAGQTYVISVAAKKYVFPEPAQVRAVTDDTLDVDFKGERS
jgi:hypothetical protein